MKCVKNSTVTRRVSNVMAEKLVNSGYKYCTKTEWKKTDKARDEVVEAVKAAKKIKSDKSRMKRNQEVVSKS